jgi:Mg-chelatase subunit ChlD
MMCTVVALLIAPARADAQATAPTTLPDLSIDAAFERLNSTRDLRDLQEALASGLAAVASQREQAQLGKTPPSDPAKRAIACRLDLLEAELNHCAGAAAQENDPRRMAYLQKSAAQFRTARIAYREIPIAMAGYAGESRVLRDLGQLPRSDRVLDPVILQLKDNYLANLNMRQLQIQRMLWIERLRNTQLRDPKEASDLIKQIAASKLLRDASDAEKKALSDTGVSFNPILEIVKSMPTTVPTVTAAKLNSAGMQDVLKDIRSRGLDVCFVLDATESMGPYIDQSKARFGDIVSIVTQMLGDGGPATRNARTAPIRFGLVAFKDYGDDYGIGATRQLPLTNDTKKLQAAFDEVIAGGGGDIPEPIDQALRVATANTMGWNRRRKNVIVLVSDAPVHGSGRDVAYAIARAFNQKVQGEINVIDVGGTVNGKRVRNTVLPDLQRIADEGRGSAFLLADEQAFWRHLIVSIFGSRYEEDVQGILDEYTQKK